MADYLIYFLQHDAYRGTAGRSSESLSYLYKYSSHKNLIAPDHYIPINIYMIKCVIELNIFPPRGVSHPS